MNGVHLIQETAYVSHHTLDGAARKFVATPFPTPAARKYERDDSPAWQKDVKQDDDCYFLHKKLFTDQRKH